MRLAALFLIVAFGIGLLMKGKFSNLAELRLRYWGLAFLGLALQAAPYPSSWGKDFPVAALLLSFVLLFAFALANIREAGFILILAGGLANFIVIAANWGMPVAREALVASDQPGPLRQLERAEATKHHLASDDDHLLFLADVIPIPDPIHLAVSVGDVLT
ncbi:MAG: DUF5317 domain-containing protein, partial [Actinobacteria bacterium]|nr:DUF5317 domain-containing protein [Actinomycetota bacterium]